MIPTPNRIGALDDGWELRVRCSIALTLSLAMFVSTPARADTASEPASLMFAGRIWKLAEPEKHLGCLGVARDQQLPIGSRVQVFVYGSEPQTAIIEELMEVPSNVQMVYDLGFAEVKRRGLWPQLACPWVAGRGNREAAVFRTEAPQHGVLIAAADVPDSAIVLGRTARRLGDEELDRLHGRLTDAAPDVCRTPAVWRSGTASARVEGHEIVDFRLGVPSYGEGSREGVIESIEVCRFILHNDALLSQWNWSRTSEPVTEESLGVLGPELTEQTWSETSEYVLGFLGWNTGQRWRMFVIEGLPEGTMYRAVDLEPEPKIVWEQYKGMR